MCVAASSVADNYIRWRRADFQIVLRHSAMSAEMCLRHILLFLCPLFHREISKGLQFECKCGPKCKCKCRFIERDYVTPLMRYRLECPANRYVFKSRQKCSESTAWSLRQSGSEFQTVGLATEKARVPKVPCRTRWTNSWWRLADRRIWNRSIWNVTQERTFVAGFLKSLPRPKGYRVITYTQVYRS